MRRFIVEVVLDAILLAFIVLLLGASRSPSRSRSAGTARSRSSRCAAPARSAS